MFFWFVLVRSRSLLFFLVRSWPLLGERASEIFINLVQKLSTEASWTIAHGGEFLMFLVSGLVSNGRFFWRAQKRGTPQAHGASGKHDFDDSFRF